MEPKYYMISMPYLASCGKTSITAVFYDNSQPKQRRNTFNQAMIPLLRQLNQKKLAENEIDGEHYQRYRQHPLRITNADDVFTVFITKDQDKITEFVTSYGGAYQPDIKPDNEPDNEPALNNIK